MSRPPGVGGGQDYGVEGQVLAGLGHLLRRLDKAPEPRVGWGLPHRKLLEAMLPVARIAVEVHHGKDEDAIRFSRIEHAIGESRCQAPAHFAFEDGPSLRVFRSTPDRGIDLCRKLEAQILLSFLIVIDGGEELLFDLRVKGLVHFSNRFQTLAKTSSPGIGFTLPERNSARRR